MVNQRAGVWYPAATKKPTGVGFSVGGYLTNVLLWELQVIVASTRDQRIALKLAGRSDEQTPAAARSQQPRIAPAWR